MYSIEETAKVKDMYAEGVAVAAIAEALDKSEKSVIGKLVSEKVYTPKAKVSKVTGDAPKTKIAFVHDIENTLGVDLEGLEKAPKTTLIKLKASLVDWLGEDEDGLGDA